MLECIAGGEVATGMGAGVANADMLRSWGEVAADGGAGVAVPDLKLWVDFCLLTDIEA